jgi:hypothetical protein
VCEEECPQRGLAGLTDDLHSAAPEAPIPPLDSHLHQGISQGATARYAGFGSPEEGLVDLHSVDEPVSAGTHHCGAVAVEHRPGGLGGADLEHALEAASGDALLIACHVPVRGERSPPQDQPPSASRMSRT